MKFLFQVPTFCFHSFIVSLFLYASYCLLILYLIIYRWQKNCTKVVSSVILVQKLTTFLQGLICMWVTFFFRSKHEKLLQFSLPFQAWKVITVIHPSWICRTLQLLHFYLCYILPIKEKGMNKLWLLREWKQESIWVNPYVSITPHNNIYSNYITTLLTIYKKFNNGFEEVFLMSWCRCKKWNMECLSLWMLLEIHLNTIWVYDIDYL